MMFTTTKKALAVAAITGVAGLQLQGDCGINCGIPANRDPDDPDAPAVVGWATGLHGGLVYLNAITATAAAALGRILFTRDDTPTVTTGPAQDELDYASDLDGDGHVSEAEAAHANNIIEQFKAEQEAELSAIVSGTGAAESEENGATDADGEQPVTTEGETEAPAPLEASGSITTGQRGPAAENARTPSGTNILVVMHESSDESGAAAPDAASGEDTGAEAKPKPKRFRPAKWAMRAVSSGRGSVASTEGSTGAIATDEAPSTEGV